MDEVIQNWTAKSWIRKKKKEEKLALEIAKKVYYSSYLLQKIRVTLSHKNDENFLDYSSLKMINIAWEILPSELRKQY